MGCGASRLEPNHEAVPARLRPIFRRRLEEIRARRNANVTGGDLSKKELLGDDHDSGSDPSFHNTQDCPPIPQKITVEPSPKPSQNQDNDDHENIRVTESLPNSLEREKLLLPEIQDGNNYRKDNNDEKLIAQKRDEGKGLEESEDEEIEDERMMVGSGSPSFRVYCLDSDDHTHNLSNKDDFDGYVDAAENNGGGEMLNEESSSSNEVSVKQAPKKGKKGRKFKKMMPKGGKHIFNMNSFYNFPCSSEHHISCKKQQIDV